MFSCKILGKLQLQLLFGRILIDILGVGNVCNDKVVDGNGNGLLFHMTQPTSRSVIKAIVCSKPTISEHYSKWKQWHNS